MPVTQATTLTDAGSEGQPGSRYAARRARLFIVAVHHTPPEVAMKVLVTAASMHGATAEIAQAIGRTLSEQGLAVSVLPPEEVASVEEYDAVVIGSAVYVGHWLDAAKDLVNRCRDALVTRPVWLFSSGPVGDPAGKLARAMDTDPVDAVAIRVTTGARDHRMFAGKLDRKVLTRPQRASLLVFRGLEGDFRDWAVVRQWADGIAQQLTSAPRA